MALLSQETPKFPRILGYGPPKNRKTLWALKGAELGYNVTILNFDNNLRIAQTLSPETLARIYSLDCWAPAGANYKAGSLPSLTKAVHGDTVFYDEETRCHVRKTGLVDDREYLRLDLTRAEPSDLVIVDTWTDVCKHVSEFVADRKNVMDLPDYGLEQSEYNKRRMIVDRLLAGLKALNCPVIFTAHSTEWGKRRADAKANAPAHEAIEAIKTVPVSVTYAHGEDFAGEMTDVAFFNTSDGMNGTMVSTKTGNKYLAGSSAVPPTNKKWEEMGIEKFLEPCPNPTPKFETKIFERVFGRDAKASGSSVLGASATPTLGLGKKS